MVTLAPPPQTWSAAPSVSLIDPLSLPDWDATLAAFPGATIFHGAAWAHVLHDTYGFTPLYLSTGETTARSLLPMMQVGGILTRRRGISLPFTDECAPLCHDQTAFDHLLLALKTQSRQRAWKHWELRGGRSFLPTAPSSLSFLGHTLLLSDSPAALFSRFDSATRRAVRKAEQSELAVEFATDLASVRSFHRLLCLTRRRHGLPPQPFSFFENIQRHILARGQGEIALAHIHGVPVAGAIFFRFNRAVLYKFGASDESFQHLRANNLVMSRAIERYAAAGCSSLDFGRTSLANEGLRRFKLGWGATERSIEYFRCHAPTDRFLTTRDDAQGWHNRLFRVLPLPLSRLIGSLAYRHMA